MYTGIKEVEFTDEELSEFYKGTLKVDALTNQYLLIKRNGEIVDKYKYDGSKFNKVKYKVLESQMLSKIKPRNIKQELFLDLLDSDIPVKCVIGVAGSGKSMLSTAYALQELDKGKYKKLVVIRNNVSVSGIEEIGAIPGDTLDKLRPYLAFIGDIISDYGMEMLLNQNKIEMVYLGTIRGRSLSDSIVFVSEAQNLTTQLIRTIITRIGENSIIIFDADLDQIDKRTFEKDNGIVSMADCLKGNKLFGMCEFDVVERSEVAKLASLIK